MIRLSLLLLLTGCGTYIGSEGVIYNPNEMIGFSTYDVVENYKKQIEASYKAGKEAAVFVPLQPVDDGSITIINKQEAQAAVVGLTALAGPFAPLAPLVPGIITLILSFFITKRKKRKETWTV